MQRKWLEMRLQETGKSKAALARSLGIEPPRISEMIKGGREIHSDEVRKLSDFLGLDIVTLLRLIEGEEVSEDNAAAKSPSSPQATPAHGRPLIHADNLGPGYVQFGSTEYASVECYDASMSAGPGSLLDEEPEFIGHHMIEGRWLRTVTSTAPENLTIVRVRGDSMDPTLKANDWVLVDTHQKEVPPEGVFALRYDGTVVVKRLDVDFRNRAIEIMSDNALYKDRGADPEDINIIGRVVAIVARML